MRNLPIPTRLRRPVRARELFFFFGVCAVLLVNVLLVFKPFEPLRLARQTQTLQETPQSLQQTPQSLQETQQSLPARIPEQFLSPLHTKVPSWDYCSRRIKEDMFDVSQGRRLEPRPFPSVHKADDYNVYIMFSQLTCHDYNVYIMFSQLTCHQIAAIFAHAQPTAMESDFPLAYILQLYKGAALFVRQLQFIYMPQNVYCVHIDKSSSSAFVNAVEQVVRCLPNVFVTKKRVEVIYYHVSTVQAQLNCIEDLLESPVAWRYMLNLCGQDFPLYTNRGIVQALQALKGKTNAESCEVIKEDIQQRTSNVFHIEKVAGRTQHEAYKLFNTGKLKTPPPHGISIRKGSAFIAGTRDFCKYAVYNETAKAFLAWLGDTICVDESFFPSLYRHSGVPGGLPLPGDEPEFILRAVRWYRPGKQNLCHGYWLREICVLGLGDLSWLLGTNLENIHKLFTQKIDFDYDEELVDCLYVAVQNRTEHPFRTNGISWNGPCPN